MYGNTIWYPRFKEALEQIERAQRRASRPSLDLVVSVSVSVVVTDGSELDINNQYDQIVISWNIGGLTLLGLHNKHTKNILKSMHGSECDIKYDEPEVDKAVLK